MVREFVANTEKVTEESLVNLESRVSDMVVASTIVVVVVVVVVAAAAAIVVVVAVVGTE